MRRIVLFCSLLMLAFSFCAFPLSAEAYCMPDDCKIKRCTDSTNDDAFTKKEAAQIIYVRNSTKLNIEQATEKRIVKTVRGYRLTGFNEHGLLNKIIKRDYSGDDWIAVFTKAA